MEGEAGTLAAPLVSTRTATPAENSGCHALCQSIRTKKTTQRHKGWEFPGTLHHALRVPHAGSAD